LHVRLSDARRGLRSGAIRVELRRTTEPRGVAVGRRDCRSGSRRARHPRPAMALSLGFSPCPNDCFMFDAIVNHRIDLEGLSFEPHLADVEALNRETFSGAADVTKLSYHAYGYCRSDYVLLDAGSALGRNCGPLLISARPITPEEVRQGNL